MGTNIKTILSRTNKTGYRFIRFEEYRKGKVRLVLDIDNEMTLIKKRVTLRDLNHYKELLREFVDIVTDKYNMPRVDEINATKGIRYLIDKTDMVIKFETFLIVPTVGPSEPLKMVCAINSDEVKVRIASSVNVKSVHLGSTEIKSREQLDLLLKSQNFINPISYIC